MDLLQPAKLGLDPGLVDELARQAQLVAKLDKYDLFVSNYSKGDGSTVNEALWLLGQNIVVSVLNFLDRETRKWDYIQLCHNVAYLRITAKDYDFEKAIRESQLTVFCVLSNQLDFTLRAVGENCDSLMLVVSNILRPHMTSEN